MNAKGPRADLLVADIGSTLTKLSAFAGLGEDARFLGQGLALTTVAEGDVRAGLDNARCDLEQRLGIDTEDAAMMASASAAGGLRMTVHGLTRDMTLRAAKEASLGAGAIVKLATAGRLQPDDIDAIRAIRPNLILLAGGVDFGDREVPLANARALANLGLAVPVIYAGNAAARREVEKILKGAGVSVFCVENVYPRIDELNVAPVRRVIQSVFADHIVTAPGMDKVKALLAAPVLPTPAAVMAATELLGESFGDVLTVDVGGATTDVHSVTDGSPRFTGLMAAPEPRSKRTVEGDLGVFINAAHVLEAAEGASLDLHNLMALPSTPEARETALKLTRWAVDVALWRHAGELRATYGAMGRRELVEGRDLTAVQWIIGSGGALVGLGEGEAILKNVRRDPCGRKLLPPETVQVALDRDYIMAAAGVMAGRYPEDAHRLLAESLGQMGRAQ